jgi:hypothetical protein
MERIGGETMVLYGDLRERLEIYESTRTISSLPGEFTQKTVKGAIYHYFQALLPGGRTQIYIGPDNERVRKLIETRELGKEHALADEKMLQRLAAQIIAGGVSPILPTMARIVTRLADSSVFAVGGVLVDTIAFQILGPHLGIIWENSSRMTQDVDLAVDARVAVAVPDLTDDVPTAIESLQSGFYPVPRLSHKEPSTSYANRSKALRIDLFTPARKGAAAPVFIHRLNAAATPLKYLDFLIEDPINAVMIARRPCLVKVPQPARYALHQLIISQERDVTSAAKTRKDLLQAISVIELLREDRPGDLELAKEALFKRGESWLEKARTVCGQVGVDL